jgi:Asp-tRNA(Asn)/Glu-tRNA(Gln) amidotransferase A subunit family amidase
MLDTAATVVERLDAAGAILVAKLTLGEFAQGDVWFGGMTKNPWKTDQGSSGSSAGPGSATAAGLVGFSIGTETLGSIVSPSTRNGVSGLRPTFGRVSKSGAMALSWSMDKIGADVPERRGLRARVRRDSWSGWPRPDGARRGVRLGSARPLSTIRVGYLKAAFDQDRPFKALDDAALDALRGMGVSPVAVEMPTGFPTGALRIILSAEAGAAFDEITRDNRDDQMVQQTASAWPNSFRASRFIPAVEYINANRARTPADGEDGAGVRPGGRVHHAVVRRECPAHHQPHRSSLGDGAERIPGGRTPGQHFVRRKTVGRSGAVSRGGGVAGGHRLASQASGGVQPMTIVD